MHAIHHAVIMPSSSLVHGCYHVAFVSAMKHTTITAILNTSSQLESHIPVIAKTVIQSWLLIHCSNKLQQSEKYAVKSKHNIGNSLIIIEINFLQWASDVAPTLPCLPSIWQCHLSEPA